MGGGLLEDEAVGYVEGALRGSLSVQKDPEPTKKKAPARVSVAALSRYRSGASAKKEAPAAAAEVTQHTLASCAFALRCPVLTWLCHCQETPNSSGMGAVATSTLAQVIPPKCLRRHYAMPGTDTAHQMLLKVLKPLLEDPVAEVRYLVAFCLCVRYVPPGTCAAFGTASALKPAAGMYAMSGTDEGCGGPGCGSGREAFCGGQGTSC
eukprot:3936514-Rhodomonas_salina.3